MSGEDFPLCAQSAAFDADFARCVCRFIPSPAIQATNWRNLQRPPRINTRGEKYGIIRANLVKEASMQNVQVTKMTRRDFCTEAAATTVVAGIELSALAARHSMKGEASP